MNEVIVKHKIHSVSRQGAGKGLPDAYRQARPADGRAGVLRQKGGPTRSPRGECVGPVVPSGGMKLACETCGGNQLRASVRIWYPLRISSARITWLSLWRPLTSIGP